MNPWSGPADEPRARRPTDLAQLVLAVVTLGVVVEARPGGGTTDGGVAAILTGWTFLAHVWWTLMVLATIAAGAMVLAALVWRRWHLARDLVVAGLVAALVMVVLYHLFLGPPAAVVEPVLTSGSALLPIVRLAIVTTVVSVVAPHVVRPLRYTGHATVTVLAIATMALGGTNVNGVFVALLVGWTAAAGAHLLFGSPGGRPTIERVTESLESLGLVVSDVRPAPVRGDGIARFDAVTPPGAVSVKVFGRDAWNGQLVAAVSRWLTMRGPGANLAATRVQQAEHEALMSLVATRHGVDAPVPDLVARAPNGDVVLVAATRPLRRPDGDAPSAIAAAWTLLDHLHDAGIVHRAITVEQLAARTDGALAFVDLDRAVLASDSRSRRIDRAQLLATTVVLAGADRAIDGFVAHHPGDAAAMMRYLQPAVLPVELRRRLKAADVDLAAVRQQIAERCGVEEPELEKVRRVSLGMIVMGLVIGVAAMFLVSTFSDLDWSEIRQALDGANWWWLIFAFVMAQATRLGGGLSMMGAVRTPLPPGPVFLLQFSFPFIDVAAPAAAGRIAATMRFQQKYGVQPTAALSGSIIDSGAGFAAQIILMAITFAVTDLNLSTLGADRFDIDLRLLLTILIVAAAAVSVVLIIPIVRRRIVGHVREVWIALGVLKSPSKFALLLGGSMLTELLHAVAMGLCLRSLGLSAPFASLLVVTAFIRFVSGISPIPGGLGIAEAGLTAGLVSIGVPVEFAFSAAMIYRLCTFYVPPAYGWLVLSILRRRDYL